MTATLLAQGSSGASSVRLPHVQYTAILPELILIGGALALLAVASLLRGRISRSFSVWFTVAVGLASVGASVWLWTSIEGGGYTAISGALAVDGFSVLFLILMGSAVVLGALISDAFLRRERTHSTEFQVLFMLSASGAMFMAAANDLIVVFLGLEIMSIALYVLAGLNSRREESGEAAIKYFVLGAFSSALFLYGIALTYGATGTTNLARIASFLASNVITSNGVLLAGLALLLVGFGFKIAAVPFHTWTPDVYQGAPSPVTGFMASVAKAGGFAALLRVFFSSFPTLRADWQPIIWVVAFLTLLLGAVMALVQRDVKRMLAYSSINHAGFVLIGLQAATRTGISGSLYYLFAYTFMVMGSFAVITVVGGRDDAAHDLDDYRGLARRHPLLAASFTVLLLSQAGIPFTTGFLSKFYVIAAGVQAKSYALAVIGMVTATIAAFFYLRLAFLMYSRPEGATAAEAAREAAREELAVSSWTGPRLAPVLRGSGAASATLAPAPDLEGPADARAAPGAQTRQRRITVPTTAVIAIGLCVVFTVLFGLWPAPIIDLAHGATLLF